MAMDEQDWGKRKGGYEKKKEAPMKK